MNKKFLLILGSIIITAFLIVGVAKAVNVYYQAEYSYGGVAASTTAVLWVGGTATTTKTSNTDGYGRISYLVALASSTTPPTLCWSNEFSDNGTDWYAESIALNANATSTISVRTAKEECWVYATTTDSTIISRGTDGKTLYIGKRIDVDGLRTGLTRTIFYLGAGVNARVDIRKILSNEVIQVK